VWKAPLRMPHCPGCHHAAQPEILPLGQQCRCNPYDNETHSLNQQLTISGPSSLQHGAATLSASNPRASGSLTSAHRSTTKAPSETRTGLAAPNT